MTKSHLQGFFAGIGATLIATTALMGLSGFQAASTKVGVIDAPRAANDTTQQKAIEAKLVKSAQDRQAILEFMSGNPTMSADNAKRFRELSLKPTVTDADRNEIDKIKQATIADDKKSRDLQTKASPTPDDLKQIEAYRTRSVANRELISRWDREFQEQLFVMRNQSQQELMDKVKAAVADIGKKEGYSVIYDSQAAPYAANDISEAVKKTLNK